MEFRNFANKIFANRTFANTLPVISPIGESLIGEVPVIPIDSINKKERGSSVNNFFFLKDTVILTKILVSIYLLVYTFGQQKLAGWEQRVLYIL